METIAHINVGEGGVHRGQAQLVSPLDIGTFGDGGNKPHPENKPLRSSCMGEAGVVVSSWQEQIKLALGIKAWGQ